MPDISEDQAAADDAERRAVANAKAFAQLSPSEQTQALGQITFPGQAPPPSTESDLLSKGQNAVLRGPPATAKDLQPIPNYDPKSPPVAVPAVASDRDATQQFMQQIGLTPGAGAENLPGRKLLTLTEQRARDEETAARQDATGASGKADVTANNRQRVQELDPEKMRRAEARLFGAPQQGGAVIIRNPGGWQPSGRAVQQAMGPEAPGARDALDDAYAEAVRSAAGGATTEKEQNETLGRLQSAASSAGEKFAVEGQRESQRASDKLSAVAGDIQKFVNDAAVPIQSPQEAMKQWGADKKIPFLLASMVSGAAGAVTGTNGNAFLENFDKFMNADINRQKDERKQKSEQADQSKGVYWALHAGFKDDDQARAATRALYYQALESRVKEAAIKYQIDSANPRYQALLSQIDTARAHEIEALAKLTGISTTVQSNDRFVPPSATVVAAGGPAGLKAGDVAKDRAWIFNGMKDLKVPETQAELDAMRSVIMAGDRAKGGLLQRFIAQYPNSIPFSAVLAQAGADPQMKQYLADLGQYVIKSGHTDFGAAFTPSEQERQAVFRSPEMIPELYNRGARKLQGDLQSVLSSAPSGHGYAVFDEMRSESRDMMNAPGSLVTATGADNTLPQALPYPPER